MIIQTLNDHIAPMSSCIWKILKKKQTKRLVLTSKNYFQHLTKKGVIIIICSIVCIQCYKLLFVCAMYGHSGRLNEVRPLLWKGFPLSSSVNQSCPVLAGLQTSNKRVGVPSADRLCVILTRLVFCFLVSLTLQMAAGCELMNGAEKLREEGMR